jgi:hypothetical protein
MSSNVIKFPATGREHETQQPAPRPTARLSSGRVLSWPGACLAGYAGGAALTILLVLHDGTRCLGFDLACFGILAAAIGWWSRPAGAASAAVIAWLFFDGFLAGRHAELRWHGNADAWRLGLLVAIAAGTSAARRLNSWRTRH